jgi:hypothetical protein
MKKLLAFLMFTASCEAITKDENPYSLKIDQETFVTDKTGILIPDSLTRLKPGNAVRIYLIDGTILNGLVKTTELIDNKILKIFGEITNKSNTGFGFGITADGTVGGAVVFRDQNLIYKIQFSEKANGFILVPDKSEKIRS